MNDQSRFGEFDDEVVRAMARWPDVPQCFGWLGLDRRGQWRIRGEIIRHPRAVAFLGRHYRDDEAGRWYVQNGPQRVFVELDYTPWVFGFDPHAGFLSHTGRASGDIRELLADDDGNLLLACSLGIGVIDDRDLAALAEFIVEADDGSALHWREAVYPVHAVVGDEVAARYGFVQQPQADPAAP